MSFSDELREKTKKLALRTIRLYQSLPEKNEAKVIGNQLLRSATSTAANYRAACRGRSAAEFTSKIFIVVEEADETVFWLEMLSESKIVDGNKLQGLINDYLEVTKILSHARKTMRKGKK